MTKKKDEWKYATRVNPTEEVERLRVHATGSLPLLVDLEDTADAGDATEMLMVGERVRRTPAEPIEVEAAAPLPEHVHASLVVEGGPARGEKFELSEVATSIGRAARVCIDDPKLSRRHAVLSYRGGDFYVRDEGSANGIYLNGAKVTDYRLRDGDKLLMGGTTLLFRLAARR